MKIFEVTEKQAKKENLRYAVQSGSLSKQQGFSLKKQLVAVLNKYAKGDDWEIKQQFLDAGLYYLGDDTDRADVVGLDIIGALYGYFQDGARRSVTKLKKEEDDNLMTFTAIPVGGAQPQVSFTWHKHAVTDGPVIAININANF
jgi:hypothetical protein